MFLRTLILLFTLYNGASKATECSARGRFPNNSIPDCRGYTMCLTGATTLMKYDLLCPESSIYSHLENQCTNVTSYQCLQNYNCTEEGDHVNSSSGDCTSYIACVKDLSNVTTARLISCPPSEIFSATERICVNESLVQCQSTTETPIVVHVTVNTTSLSGNFSVNNNAVRISQNGIYVTLILFLTLNIINV